MHCAVPFCVQQKFPLGAKPNIAILTCICNYVTSCTRLCLNLLKVRPHLNRITYHGIYQDGALVVSKEEKSVQEIKHWLAEFKKTVDKEVGNKHLQFTTKIWTNDTHLPHS